MVKQTSRRQILLTMAATGVLAGVGVAVGGMVGNAGGGGNGTGADARVAVVTQSPTPAPATPVATQQPLPTKKPTPQVRTTKIKTQSRPVKPARPTATAPSCPGAAARVAAARGLMRHPSDLPNVTVVPAGPRDGLLADATESSRTVTLYVRDCAEETTSKLAYVYAYEVGQFIGVNGWDAAQQASWAKARGLGASPSMKDLVRDVASVYALWQTGQASDWQSTTAPPSSSQLLSLVPKLHA